MAQPPNSARPRTKVPPTYRNSPNGGRDRPAAVRVVDRPTGRVVARTASAAPNSHPINLVLLIAVLAGLAMVVGWFELSHQNLLYPNIRVGGVSVGNLTLSAAEAKVAIAQTAMLDRPIILDGPNNSRWTVTPRSLGMTADARARVESAFAWGRTGGLLHQLGSQLDLLLNGRTLALTGSYDAARLHDYVQTIAASIGRPAISAALHIDLHTATVVMDHPAQQGQQLDTPQTEALLARALPDPQQNEIALPVNSIPPDITTDSATQEQQHLGTLLRARYTLTGIGHSWTISGPTLASLFTLSTTPNPAGATSVGGGTIYQDTVNSTALQTYVNGLANQINVPAREASLTLSGASVRFSPGRIGRRLDSAATVALISPLLEEGGPRALTLPVNQVTPRVSPQAAQLEAAHLRQLLSARLTLTVPAARFQQVVSGTTLANLLTLQTMDQENGTAYVDGVSRSAVASLITMIAKTIARPPIPPAVQINGTQVIFTPARSGLKLDSTNAQTALASAVMGGITTTVSLPVTTLASPISNAAAQAVAAQATKMLAQPTVLAYNSYRWTISPQTMATMLAIHATGNSVGGGLVLDIDQNALGQALTPAAPILERAARSASFAANGDRVWIVPDQPGTHVDIATLTERLLTTAGSGRPVVVPAFVYQPPLTTADAQQMGIDTVIGSADTYFYGSSAARMTNIAAAVRHLDGTLIAPGETFSFNKSIGNITPQEGYVQGIDIINDKDVPGIGGGVCQVADTLFKGAIFSGLPIEAWQNHSNVVPYYQPVGMDATVYVSPQGPDVAFKNDTGHWVFIKLTLDPANYHLTVRLFGKNIGTKTVVTGPTAITHPNGSIDAVFHRTVYRNGKIIYDRDFKSHYAPTA